MPQSPVFKLLFGRNENNGSPHFAGNAIFAEKTDSNVMRIDWRFQKALLGHLLLSILFFWYYTDNSFLRPAVDTGTECFLALLIIVAAEVNFWVLYPACQNNKRLFIYIVLTAIEIIVVSAIEHLLTIDTNLSRFRNMELLDNERFQIKISLFTNLIFRNCGLFGLVMLLAYNADLRIRLFDQDRKLFRLKRQLLVRAIKDKSSHLLDSDKICYVQQQQNYNNFYTRDGKRYDRRATLTDIQSLLGEEEYLQISKSVIVRKSCLKSCSEDEIVLSTDENVEDYRLTIGKGYRSEVLPVVSAVLDKVKKDMPESGDPQPQPSIPNLCPKALAIFQYISTSPGCKITDIVERTNLPKSTVTRYLKKLQQEGHIKYEGNKRVGGYQVTIRPRPAEEPQQQSV